MTALTRVRTSSALVILAMFGLQACSDSSGPATPASVNSSGSVPASAAAGSALTPAVLVSDDAGRPIRGTSVTFEVTGGGSITTPTATTNSDGVASPGQWTLSTATGVNTLRATAGAASQTFTVQVVAGPPAAITAIDGNPSTGTANAVLDSPPAVRVTDQFGNPVPNVTVTFTPDLGSGTVTGGTQTTGADGVARPGSWTLGPDPQQRLYAQTGSLIATIVVVVQATVLTRFAGDGTTCPVNSTGCRFTVSVTTGTGQPMVGTGVTWTTPQGATLATVTNAKGRVTVANLFVETKAEAGSQTARLDETGQEVTFNFDFVQPGQYNLDIDYINPPPASQRVIFNNAVAKWHQVITGDLPPVNVTVPANACAGIPHPAFSGVVDDLLIFVSVDSIDGVGGVLGRAGPCFVRSASRLPVVGIMQFDRDDFANMEANGTLYDVILHELGHIIGFGTIWTQPEINLLVGGGGSNPQFTGMRAQSAFALVGGSTVANVPVENTGGPGTRDGHWRESLFSNELMTGFVNNAPNPLSVMTIASFMDLGYEVNFGAADTYSIPGSLPGLRAAQPFLFELPHTEPLLLDRPFVVPAQ